MSETRRFVPPKFWRWRRPGVAEETTEAPPEPTETEAPPPEPAEEPAPAEAGGEPSPAAAEEAAPAAVENSPEAERSSGLRGLWRRLGPSAAEPAAEEPAPAKAGVEPPPAPSEEPAPAAAEVAPPSEPVEVVEPAPAPLVAPPPAAAEAAAEAERRGGWFGRLRAGLQRSSARLNQGINTIFLRRRLDDAALAELEELLIASDMGVGIAEEVTESLRRTRFNQEVTPEEVRTALADQVVRLVEPVMKPLRLDPAKKPFVILVIGVNGSGKTTT
ncbi:MAG TPA: signal recognition particle receptor subunit alpha, partial [Stellaceae bacterium]|nr:signal recognition particle receptor subunit alpha [Stellaceae bacterium]